MSIAPAPLPSRQSHLQLRPSLQGLFYCLIVFPELLPDTQNLKVCFLSLASLAQILKQPKSCIQTKRLHCIIHTLKYDHYFRQCPCLSVLNVCSFSLFHSRDHLAFELISTYWLAWVTKINKGYQIGPKFYLNWI